MPKKRKATFIISGAMLVVLAGVRFIAYPLFVSTPDAVQVSVMQTNLSGVASTTVFSQRFSTQE
jgi:hypothetical protein